MAKKTKSQATLGLIKVPTMVYLEPEQATALRALSTKTGKPQQVYLREGLDLILKKYGGK